jgi:hypothetical protein
MIRIALCLLSGLVLAVAYVALSGAPSANAEGILAPGNPPLTRDVSDASAAVTLFMLKHVASGDASAGDLTVDDGLLDAWADSMTDEYATFSSDEQAQLAIMPALRGALVAAWPQAGADDRAEIRDAFRPLAEGWLADLSCDGFISLADAGFVEKTSANVKRYLSCEDAGLDSTTDSVAAPAPSGPVAPQAKPTPAPVTASAASSSGMTPPAAAQRASAGLQASHTRYTNMSNVLLQNHVGNKNAILHMGNNTSHYVYSKP